MLLYLRSTAKLWSESRVLHMTPPENPEPDAKAKAAEDKKKVAEDAAAKKKEEAEKADKGTESVDKEASAKAKTEVETSEQLMARLRAQNPNFTETQLQNLHKMETDNITLRNSPEFRENQEASEKIIRGLYPNTPAGRASADQAIKSLRNANPGIAKIVHTALPILVGLGWFKLDGSGNGNGNGAPAETIPDDPSEGAAREKRHNALKKDTTEKTETARKDHTKIDVAFVAIATENDLIKPANNDKFPEAYRKTLEPRRKELETLKKEMETIKKESEKTSKEASEKAKNQMEVSKKTLDTVEQRITKDLPAVTLSPDLQVRLANITKRYTALTATANPTDEQKKEMQEVAKTLEGITEELRTFYKDKKVEANVTGRLEGGRKAIEDAAKTMADGMTAAHVLPFAVDDWYFDLNGSVNARVRWDAENKTWEYGAANDITDNTNMGWTSVNQGGYTASTDRGFRASGMRQINRLIVKLKQEQDSRPIDRSSFTI